MSNVKLFHGNCEELLNTEMCYEGRFVYWGKYIHDNSIDLIYIDPPFNTGIRQFRSRFHTKDGEKIEEESYGYNDKFDNYIEWMESISKLAYRKLKPTGSFFFHIDYREAHYCKVMLDKIFGRYNFINEIIWAYDYGARSKTRWSCKHDTIFYYVKDKTRTPVFNYNEIDRIPYLAPSLVGEEKAERGKTPTDVWWNTIVSPTGKEKTGYATQKPINILKRIISVHSNPGDLVLDFFAGSGTTGAAAYELDRDVILCDKNPDAIKVIKKRFSEKYNLDLQETNI